MVQITQGAIICGVRSNKYPEAPSCGIIISARCDVENCKIAKLYYLIAVDAREWLCSETGYNEAYAEKIKQSKEEFADQACKHSLNPQLLQNFTEEEFKAVLEDSVQSRKDRGAISKAYKKFCDFGCPQMSAEKRLNAIRKDAKPAEKFLAKISKGEIVHYFFLPQVAYSKDGEKSNGFIVDLQEIEALSIKDAEQIQSPGIDYMLLSMADSVEQMRLASKFWLKTENDFVTHLDSIGSPWIELLMQRFSHAFIRVGVDGATLNDFTDLVRKI